VSTQLVVVVVDLFDEPDEAVLVDVLAEPAGRLTDACGKQERLRRADGPVAEGQAPETGVYQRLAGEVGPMANLLEEKGVDRFGWSGMSTTEAAAATRMGRHGAREST
jgi:hypothetical protein